MPFGIAPMTMLLVGVAGGIGAAVTFTSYRFAQTLGPKLTPTDLLPAPPWIGLPLPIFFYTKPELLQKLRRK